MATPAGTFQTYQAIGNKEDVSKIIWNVDPDDTPFISMIGREKVVSVLPEWQTDTLAVPAANAQVEGDDVATLTAVPTVRLRNYVQTLAKVVRVSETQRNVEAYGRSDELEYQVEKRMREIKTDLEYAAVGNQQSTAGTTSVARTMAGYESWVASNRTSVGTGTNQSTYGYSGGTVLAPVDSTVTGTMTETSLRQVIAACYTAGGDPEILMAGVAIKARMSQVLTGIATRYRNVESGKMAQIIGGADLYVSDFGTHKIVPNRVISRGSTSRDRNILVIDPTYWKLGVLQDWRMKDLAKTGLSDRKIISGEFTLMALNEKSSGKVTDISATL
jgi:hypothetical protein